MKYLILSLLVLTSCTATFRGTLLDIEEASFGMNNQKKGEKIIKEIIVGDSNAVEKG